MYGQPSWWGEEEEEATGPSGDASGHKDRRAREDGLPGGRRSRPNSLTLSGDEADHFPQSSSASAKKTANRSDGKPPGAGPGHKRMNGERIKPTYMEIPFGDDDNGASKSVDDASTASSRRTASAADSSASTPAKSISSSLSRDSLLDSPDARKVR